MLKDATIAALLIALSTQSLRMRNNILVLEPSIAIAPGMTHAVLVVSTAESKNSIRFSADFETQAQLRVGSEPNPWETAWAVFGYTDTQNFYYVAFKTNGWELGKRDPAYPGGQRFLASGSEPAFSLGAPRRFEIKQNGAAIQFFVDGREVTSYTDSERPLLSGKVGFYCEDSRALFWNVSGNIHDDFNAYPRGGYFDGQHIGSAWLVQFAGYGSVSISAQPRFDSP